MAKKEVFTDSDLDLIVRTLIDKAKELQIYANDSYSKTSQNAVRSFKERCERLVKKTVKMRTEL